MKLRVICAILVLAMVGGLTACQEPQPENPGATPSIPTVEFVVSPQEYDVKRVSGSNASESDTSADAVDSQANAYRVENGKITRNGDPVDGLPGIAVALNSGTDGNIYAIIIENAGKFTLYRVDSDSLKRLVELPESSSAVITGSGEFSVFVVGATRLFGYGDYTLTQMFQLSDYGLTYSQIAGIAINDDQSMLVQRKTLNPLLLTPAKPGASRTVLTLAAFSEALSSRLVNEVALFNEENSEFRIEIKTYSFSNAVKLYTEIASGEVPDMIDLKFLRFPKSRWSEFFVDLRPLIDSDAEISFEDFNPEMIRTAMYGESLYYARSTASMDSVVVPSFDGQSAWNWETFVRESSEFKYPISMFRGAFMTQMYYALYDDLVNWEQFTCDFDGSLFKEYLAVAAGLPDEYANGQFLTAESMRDPETTYAITVNSMDLTGGFHGIPDNERKTSIALAEYPLLGFPTPSGGRTIMQNDDSSQIAIFRSSEHGAECWKFIRRFFTPEFQERRISGMSVAFRKDSQQARMQFLFDNADTETPITARELEVLELMIDSPMVANGWMVDTRIAADPILTIILEEAAAYFAGDKSAEECARVIQSRASLYVGEQR